MGTVGLVRWRESMTAVDSSPAFDRHQIIARAS